MGIKPSLRGEKLPRIHPAHGKALTVVRVGKPHLERTIASSSRTSVLSAISESSSGSSVTEEHYTWKMMRKKEMHKPVEPALPATLHTAPAAPAAPAAPPQPQEPTPPVSRLPPTLLQRRDPRTQVYTEMAKQQKEKVDHLPAAPPGLPPMPIRPRQEAAPVQAKPSEPELPQIPSPERRDSLIDPNQQYSADRSNWRSDLYKLMMLRIAPPEEGRTATQDLLASAKFALGGRALSWEAFAGSDFSALKTPEQVEAAAAKWQRYAKQLLGAPAWVAASKKSLEAMAAMKSLEAEAKRGKGVREKAGMEQGEVDREPMALGEKLRETDSKEGRLRKKAKRMAAQEEKGPERPAEAEAEVEKEAAKSKESRVGLRLALSKEEELEASWEKGPPAVPKGRKREATRGRERELAKGREREPRGREREPARERELEAGRRREKEAKEREPEEPEERRAEVAGEAGKEPSRESLTKARGLLTDSDQRPKVTESVLGEIRAEAKERMLTELMEQEAKRRSVDEAREKALAQARLVALSEAREKALIKARKRAFSEQWEKTLAEARRSTELEAMDLALAKAKAKAEVLAERKEGSEAEQRVRELTKAQAVEMAKARARGAAILVDEQRILELAEEEGLEVDEARVLELARAMEEKLLAVEEERLAVEEEGLWEDKDSFHSYSEEVREALLALWGEQEDSEEELGLSEQTQLLLEILTEPEKLEASDSAVFQRLFRALSLLQVPSTADVGELAEMLLRKAKEVLEEGKELADVPSSVWRQLKGALEARQPWGTDPDALAGKMGDLQKTATAILRARNLKQRLEREVMTKTWWEKEEREWAEGEGRIKGKQAWLRKRFKEAIRTWQGELREAEQERQERRELKRHQDHLQFRARPIVLAVSRRGRRKESRQEGEGAGAVEAEEEEAPQEVAKRPDHPHKMTWSLTVQRKRAWQTIMQLEELSPAIPAAAPATGAGPQLPMPKHYRVPWASMYKAPQPTPQPHHKVAEEKSRPQHAFRPDARKLDWDRFTRLYQSLLALRSEEGGLGSATWQDKSSQLLGIYGVSKPLIQTMIQQALLGRQRERAYIRGKPLRMRRAKANLGERILSRIVHYGGRRWRQRRRQRRRRPGPLHGVIPLSYQNNVQTFRTQGVSHFGTLALWWKTFHIRGKPSDRLHFYVGSSKPKE